MFAIAIITFVSLSGSFLCSIMEAALYSIPRSRIESLIRAGDRGATRLASLRAKIDEPIAAILTLNTTSNTLGAAWAGALVGAHYGDATLGIFSAGFTAAVLFFSEIIPKSLGVTFASKLAPRLALPIQILIWVFWPLIKMCVALTRLWGKDAHLNYPTEEDIISLTQLSRLGGVILPEEARWVANALRLNNLRVQDIMTPKSVVTRLPDTALLRETKMEADEWRFSRVPVYGQDNPDNIIGVARRREVFAALIRGDKSMTIGDIIDPPDFISEKLAVHQLLNRFIESRRHLFCVKDTKGEFTGVVALEDVLESLIGAEIVDELDLHEDMQVLALRRSSKNSSQGDE